MTNARASNQTRKTMPKISHKRRARYGKIHACLNDLDWGESQYRDMLFAEFGVASKTVLTLEQLDSFIQTLRLAMLERGLVEPKEIKWGWGSRKYDQLQNRAGSYASPAQLRKIEATWREVARNPSDEALQSFIKRQTDVDHIIWLDKEEVKPVLIALKHMKKTTREQPSSGDGQPVENRSEEEDLATMTQCERLLWWLRNKGDITALEAQQKLGIGRLAARVYDLRQDGHRIDSLERTVTTRMSGETTVAVYRLDTE